MGKNNQNYFEEEEEEEGENDIEKEMDEENGFSFTKQKNCQNIIKHSNDMVIQHDELGNEFGDYMNKNIYPGFQINNSLSNLDFTALNGNNMSKDSCRVQASNHRSDLWYLPAKYPEHNSFSCLLKYLNTILRHNK